MAGEMIIYTDGDSSAITRNMTPAQRYAGDNDFSHILDDINTGVLPCETGEPFPVINNQKDDTSPPWYEHTAFMQPTNKLNIPWEK